MTNEELDRARSDEATRICSIGEPISVIAARLAREGWTPPEVVDPDTLADPDTFEASAIIVNQNIYENVAALVLDAIRRGRALAAAEAKPGVVWVKHDGSKYCPAPLGVWVTTRVNGGGYVYYSTQMATDSNWRWVTHYAIITPPAEDVA